MSKLILGVQWKQCHWILVSVGWTAWRYDDPDGHFKLR